MKIQAVILWVEVKMGAAWSAETSVFYHIITQCHNPEDHDLSNLNIVYAIFPEVVSMILSEAILHHHLLHS